MNDDILYSEPGFEKLKGTSEGERKNRAYQNIVKYGNIMYAMLDQIENPPPEFEFVIKNHFYLKKDIILSTVENWIELAKYDTKYNTDYSGLVQSHNNNLCNLFNSNPKTFLQQLKVGYEKLQKALYTIQIN